MRIQQTSRIITVSVVLLSLLTIASAIVSQEYRKLQEENYARRRIALNTAPQLAAGSDRLTNAVRAYAATGEPRYTKISSTAMERSLAKAPSNNLRDRLRLTSPR